MFGPRTQHNDSLEPGPLDLELSALLTVYPIWQLNFTTFVIMKMIKLRASDWLETSAFSCNTNAKLSHECPIKICLSSFSVRVSPIHY